MLAGTFGLLAGAISPASIPCRLSMGARPAQVDILLGEQCGLGTLLAAPNNEAEAILGVPLDVTPLSKVDAPLVQIASSRRLAP